MLSFSSRTAKRLYGNKKPVQWLAAASYNQPTALLYREDYEKLHETSLLHRSILPTDHFRYSLPKLPIPKLENTCSRYLESQRPFLTEEEFNSTKQITEEFKKHDDTAFLEDWIRGFDAHISQGYDKSYIEEPWSDMYLRDRRAVVLNHNPFMTFKDDARPEYNRQDVRATNMLVAALRFMNSLRANVLEPEIFHMQPQRSDNDMYRRFLSWMPERLRWYASYMYKAFPLDMNQYESLFNNSRIPRAERDQLYNNCESKEMLIMRNGHMYLFNPVDKNGNLKPVSEILACIQYILNDPTPPAEHPVGILTSLDRDTWTKVRQQLEAAGNSDAYWRLSSAFFALCLDDCVTTDAMSLARNFLHGDGKNRWADKSFSIIMQKDGKATVNFEHSWGDGVAVLRMMNEVHKCSTEDPACSPETKPAPVDPSKLVTRLEFNLTDELKASIKDAERRFNATTQSLDMDYLKIDGVGKDLIKKSNLSPDSFMQLAIQLAYWKLHRRSAATYESCSTAAFNRGRTETVRPVTMATKQACELFDQSGSSAAERLNAMTECSRVHNKLTREAAMGQGWDRHLFALKWHANRHQKTLAMFQDPNYEKINKIILSTSTVTSPALEMGGFGPVNPDSYGIGYACQPDFSGYLVTTYRDQLKVAEFLDAMQSVYKDLSAVLQKSQK